MTLIERVQVATPEDDDGPFPTAGQQALAEQRLAEMMADPSNCEPVESLIAYAKSLMR